MSEGPWIIDSYPVVGELGRGGFSVVYEVVDRRLDRNLALKLLASDVDAAARQRFETEARAAAKIVHPNVVQVFGAGEWEQRLYILQELVAGLSLGEVLEARGRLSPSLVAEIATQVAEAMASAESVGVVHRDIKPQNLLLTEQGQVKVADFGVAKLLYAPGALTAEGTTLGTPHYMSPEQSQGTAVDGRCDQYGLGATLYHLLTGKPPFDDETTYGLLRKHVESPLQPLATQVDACPDALAQAVERLLAKAPEDRFLNFDEVADVFSEIEGDRAGLLELAPRESARPTKKPTRRLSVALTAVATIAALVLLGFVMMRRPSMRSKAPSSPVTETPALPLALVPQVPAAVAPTPGPAKVGKAREASARVTDPKQRSTRSLLRDLKLRPTRAVAAARELGRRADHSATDALLDALQQARSSEVRLAAADAIGQLGDIRAIERLDRIAENNPREEVKKAALRARRGLLRFEGP